MAKNSITARYKVVGRVGIEPTTSGLKVRSCDDFISSIINPKAPKNPYKHWLCEGNVFVV